MTALSDAGRDLRRVLYVEDNPDIVLIARYALEKLGGLEVLFCENGEEALGAVDAYRPDLVVLDVMLPGMDGLTLFQHLRCRESCRAAPFVFVTAKAQAYEVAQLRNTGAADVIVKPFDAIRLPSVLSDIWRRSVAAPG